MDALPDYEVQFVLWSLRVVETEVALFVIYSLVAVPGIYVLTLNLYRHGRTSGNMLVTTSCAIMYLLASVHCGFNFWRLSDVIKAQLAIGNDESEWGPVVAKGSVERSHVDCAMSGLLIVNIVLGDMIVLWRVWLIYSRNRVVLAISTIMLLGTTIMLSLSAEWNSCSSDLPESPDYFAFSPWRDPAAFSRPQTAWTDPYGSAAMGLSWLTNCWATAMLACQAWRHRKSMKRDFQRDSMSTIAQRVLLYFAESGIVYCMLWAVLVAYSIVNWAMLKYPDLANYRAAQFLNAIEVLKAAGLIDLIGIYPTALVLLVALTRTYHEHHAEPIRVRTAPPPQLLAPPPDDTRFPAARSNFTTNSVRFHGSPKIEKEVIIDINTGYANIDANLDRKLHADSSESDVGLDRVAGS